MSTLDEALIGHVIANKYRVDKVVARGGFSSVYRGVHLGIERPIAIKALEITDDVQASWIERFSREAKVVSQLSHPNTITIFDFGQEESYLYIIMEYVQGRSMSRYIKKNGPLAPEQLARFAIQIARSLDEAHHLGILHRDLKPSNVMIGHSSSGEETVKVLDFGVAKLLQPEPDVDIKLTQVGSFVGTPRYASPEQLRREELDHRSDIYGLGMLMWEGLTGKPAVDGTDYGSAIQHHLSPDPWRIPSHFDVPEELADIVHRCIEKSRANRYITCGQLADDLEAFVGNLQFGSTNRIDPNEFPSAEILADSRPPGHVAPVRSERPSAESPQPPSDGFRADGESTEQKSRFERQREFEERPTERLSSVPDSVARSTVDDEDFFDLDPIGDSQMNVDLFDPDAGEEFLGQFDDDEGVPEDLLTGPPARTPDGERTRSFLSSQERPDRSSERPGSRSDERVAHRRDEGLEEDPFGEGVLSQGVSEETGPSRSSREFARQPAGPPPDRSDFERDRRREPIDERSERPVVRPTPAMLFGVAALLLGGLGVIGYSAYRVWAGGMENPAFVLPDVPRAGEPSDDPTAKAEAEVDRMLEEASTPRPAAHDGTPTISPKAIEMALVQGGWRPSKKRVNDLGDLEQISLLVTKEEMAASLTIYRTRSPNIAEDLLAETRSPAEGITFGSTMVRVSPGPSRMKSGVTPVIARLYAFKNIARETAGQEK